MAKKLAEERLGSIRSTPSAAPGKRRTPAVSSDMLVPHRGTFDGNDQPGLLTPWPVLSLSVRWWRKDSNTPRIHSWVCLRLFVMSKLVT